MGSGSSRRSGSTTDRVVNEQEFDELWSRQESLYPDAQPLPGGQAVHIYVDPEYGATSAGQAAAITAASLFGRMSKTVAVRIPSVPVVAPLPWVGSALDDVMMRILSDAHQYGRHEQRPARPDDLRIVIGPGGDGIVVHGAGWDVYYGSARSPLPVTDDPNPFGPAFAVVAAAAQVQIRQSNGSFEPKLVDTYAWRQGRSMPEAPHPPVGVDLGELWCIGVGSVGSASLFFLNLLTRAYRAVLVDRDIVKLKNVTRSPLFSWRDAELRMPKVEVVRRALHDAGVARIEPHQAWLDDIPARWSGRDVGTPDILISAANERSVRSVIEAGHPPLQVYGTTGRNWQATLFRHIPMVEACSRCIPGGQVPTTTALCATGSSTPDADPGGEGDVALPFLSYAAGLMTAAEIAKLNLPGAPETPNRIFFEPRSPGLVRGVALRRRDGCICQLRDAATHEAVIRGSRFAHLSG